MMGENIPTRIKIVCDKCKNEILCVSTVKFGSGMISVAVDIELSTKPFCKTCGLSLQEYRSALSEAMRKFATSTIKKEPT